MMEAEITLIFNNIEEDVPLVLGENAREMDLPIIINGQSYIGKLISISTSVTQDNNIQSRKYHYVI